jgi:hypothetical protein
MRQIKFVLTIIGFCNILSPTFSKSIPKIPIGEDISLGQNTNPIFPPHEIIGVEELTTTRSEIVQILSFEFEDQVQLSGASLWPEEDFSQNIKIPPVRPITMKNGLDQYPVKNSFYVPTLEELENSSDVAHQDSINVTEITKK